MLDSSSAISAAGCPSASATPMTLLVSSTSA
jgi:hypothetical protein